MRGSARAAVRLLRTDPATFNVWVRHVRAMEQALGVEAAHNYTDVVVRAAKNDGGSIELAHSIPDLFAQVDPANRQRFVGILMRVLETHPAAAKMVARTLPALLDTMDDHTLASFVAKALSLHDGSARKAESFLRMESETAHVAADTLVEGTSLRSMYRQLTLYARAHCGESVQIRPGGERAFTDGRNLYLPNRISVYGDERDVEVYRVLTARASGFIEFGSLNLDLEVVGGSWPAPREGEMVLDRMLRGFANPSIARSLFLMFEHARVEARLRQVYPGVARRMDTLGPDWRIRVDPSLAKTAVDQVLALVLAKITGGEEPVVDAVCIGIAESVLSHVQTEKWVRVEDTVAAVVSAYPLIDALLERVQETAQIGLEVVGFDPQALSQSDRDVEVQAESLLRSLKDVSPQDWKDARDKAKNERQSYEEMSDFLDSLSAPDGPLRNHEEDAAEAVRSGRFSDDPDVDHDVGVGVFQYPEWDHQLMDYKPGWVRLTEYALRAGHTDFVDAVIAEHGQMIDGLRKSFEALRPESTQRLRGLTDGDELDFDAVVKAHISRRAGHGGEEGLYIKKVRANRDVAVAFLVDMSSSTNEHINTASKRIIDVEREALVLTSEAIHALGDDAAIYGYSGFGRDQVAFYVAKEFSDPWDDRVRERIGRIGWKMENRDGAAIRHAITKMADHPAKVKLLILLSDGKPLDCGCDHYSDVYAQEDTRQALIEARQQGVHPFCITVDPHGRTYLRRMYGDGSYTIIDSVEALPQRLPTIYRRLTR